MKKSKLQATLSTLGFLIVSACGSPFNSQNSNSYQIPWRSDDGSYRIQTVQINSLTEPEKLSGPLVHLFVTPGEEDGQLQGPPAIGRFMTRKDGVHVPLDFVSLQGASIQATFERLHEFDKAVGVDTLLQWPLQISVETQLTGNDMTENNAFYDGNRNAILILPYTDNKKEGLPLSLNSGVLAHEHFHSVFYKIVLNQMAKAGLKVDAKVNEIFGEPSTSTPDLEKVGTVEPSNNLVTFNKFMLTSINEGLADFWSWLAIGDEEFVGRSIESQKACRSLKAAFSQVPIASVLKEEVLFQDSIHRSGLAYQVGSQYARFFKEMTLDAFGDQPTYADRIQMAQALIRGLKENLASEVTQDFARTEIPTDQIIDSVIKSFPTNLATEKVCGLVAQFKQPGAKLPAPCDKITIDQNKIQEMKVDRSNQVGAFDSCSESTL